MKADHQTVKRQLSIAKGQIEGLLKMVDQDAYCIDVSNQLMATIGLLKKLNALVLSAHLSSCVKSADENDIDQKIKELQDIISRML